MVLMASIQVKGGNGFVIPHVGLRAELREYIKELQESLDHVHNVDDVDMGTGEELPIGSKEARGKSWHAKEPETRASKKGKKTEQTVEEKDYVSDTSDEEEKDWVSETSLGEDDHVHGDAGARDEDDGIDPEDGGFDAQWLMSTGQTKKKSMVQTVL